MNDGRTALGEDQTDDRKPDAGGEPDGADERPRAPRSQEEVAREIGAAAGAGDPDEVSKEALDEDGPLRFDKSGALAGRKKLRPVKALRKDEPEAEAAPEDGAGDTEAAEPRKPRKASLPPKLGALRPDSEAAASSDDTVSIPAGSFLYGETKTPEDLPAFRIDKRPVTNADYETFATATGHRPPLYWPDDGLLDELRDHPVVGVDYFDALAYAQWCGKDLPYEDEWERAARGTDGRTYPWGNDQELSGANTARVGLKMTVPVDLHKSNLSPDGCLDMVGNAWEITHSPAPGGGVVVRGGSWYDFALYAKTFFRFASRPDARNGTIGFRCCARDEPREDAPREVSAEETEAEIAARRGPQAPVDRSEWSVERRDQLLDLPRLRMFIAEARAEALLGSAAPESHEVQDLPLPGSAPAAPAPQVGKGADGRMHVSGARSGAAPAEAPPSFTTAPGAGTFAGAAGGRKAPQAKQPSSRSMPRTMWVLLIAGFLLFGGLLVILVNRDGPGGTSAGGGAGDSRAIGGPDDPEVRNPLDDLPDAISLEELAGANRPPLIYDGADKEDIVDVEQGIWLLVFMEAEGPAAEKTFKAAHRLHRRLSTAGIHVAPALVRSRYQANSGGILPEEQLLARLKADGSRWLWDAIPVVLDPEVKDGAGMLRLRFTHGNVAAVVALVVDGELESRVTPPEGGFTEVDLVPIAKRALEFAKSR